MNNFSMKMLNKIDNLKIESPPYENSSGEKYNQIMLKNKKSFPPFPPSSRDFAKQNLKINTLTEKRDKKARFCDFSSGVKASNHSRTPVTKNKEKSVGGSENARIKRFWKKTHHIWIENLKLINLTEHEDLLKTINILYNKRLKSKKQKKDRFFILKFQPIFPIFIREFGEHNTTYIKNTNKELIKDQLEPYNHIIKEFFKISNIRWKGIPKSIILNFIGSYRKVLKQKQIIKIQEMRKYGLKLLQIKDKTHYSYKFIQRVCKGVIMGGSENARIKRL